MDADKWEFANEAFLRGQKQLLKNIKRKRAPCRLLPPPQAAVGPCVELDRFGQEAEVDRLRRDKQVLVMELVKLRQQQQNTRFYLQQMETRLQGTERKQQQMMKFLAKAMQNPDFIQQLVRGREKRKELEEAAMSRKRRWPIQHEQVSELEALALEMQGLGKAKREEEMERLEHADKELDEGFWEELLNQQNEDDEEDEDEDEEDVNLLVDRLGCLGSSSKREI